MTLINPYHLKYFVDAVELGSISASAQKNLVSHPAVSRAISAIEAHYKISLLEHRKKSFEVTAEGYKLARTARELLKTIEQFESNISENANSVTGNVILGMSRSIGQAFLGRIIDTIRKKYPEISIEIKFGTTSELIDKLLHGDLDLAITVGKQAMPTLNQNILKNGKFVLIQSGNRVDASHDIKKLITTEPKFETELLKKSYFKSFKKILNPKLVVGSWDMIASLVADGKGIGLVPDLVLTGERKIKIVSQNWFQCSYEIVLNQKSGGHKNISQKVVAEAIFKFFKSRN